MALTGLSGNVALVTGGSLGIGRAIVLALAREGADVAFTFLGFRVNAAEHEDVVKEVRSLGRRCLAVESDVSKFRDAEAVVRRVVRELGGLHILVNNAGITRDGVIWKMDEEQWDTVLDVNLKGCFNYIRAASPVFREQRYGKIVSIASINGMRGKFGQANYAASKAGIIGLTKTVAKELGKYNVNVNAIAPGMIETDMTQTLSEEVKQQSVSEIVLGRFGQPEDIAEAVAFLVSEKARHITGEVMKVDGGQYI
ncbi:MAG TPA: beta-ketoacyl-ACP reductase [Bacteroidota bacterium]|nr:beta-ketoacyl-ACP reductase [Bacteroidota bacterium]